MWWRVSEGPLNLLLFCLQWLLWSRELLSLSLYVLFIYLLTSEQTSRPLNTHKSKIEKGIKSTIHEKNKPSQPKLGTLKYSHTVNRGVPLPSSYQTFWKKRWAFPYYVCSKKHAPARGCSFFLLTVRFQVMKKKITHFADKLWGSKTVLWPSKWLPRNISGDLHQSLNTLICTAQTC